MSALGQEPSEAAEIALSGRLPARVKNQEDHKKYGLPWHEWPGP
jgi:hypothetical protein